MKQKIEWQPIEKTTVHHTRIFDIENITSISPYGEEKTFVSINSPEWAIVVPTLKKEDMLYFIMVSQWRHGTSCVIKEFPGGVVNKNEKTLDAAKRELLEETGYKTKRIEELGRLFPNPAIMQNMCHIFFAECEEEPCLQNTDNDEFIDIFLVPYKELLTHMGQSPYQHALMCSALFLYLQKYGHK